LLYISISLPRKKHWCSILSPIWSYNCSMHYKTLCMDWHSLNLTATFECCSDEPSHKEAKDLSSKDLFVLYT
jgi:hypothetical protein